MKSGATDKKTKKQQGKQELKFSKKELEFMRDLMSVMLPDCSMTVAHLLASHKGFDDQHTRLWRRIYKACEEADIPVGFDAPDIVMACKTTQLEYQIRELDPQDNDD